MLDHEAHEKHLKRILTDNGGVVVVDHGQNSGMMRLTVVRDDDGDAWLLVSVVGETTARVCIGADILHAASDNFKEAGL